MSKPEKILTGEPPWTQTWQEVVERLGTSPEDGLSSAEVQRNRRRFGVNRLRARKRKSAWIILFDQLKNFMVLGVVTRIIDRDLTRSQI